MSESYIRGRDQGNFLDVVTLGSLRALPIQTLDSTGLQNGTTTNPVVTAPPSANRSDTYTAPGNGTTVNVSANPSQIYSIQVVGTGAAATSWDVRLEGSLDNVNFDQILQHTQVTGNGKVLFSGGSFYLSLYFRSRCAALSLGAATNIVVYIVGM